jgi:hypothetical protein
MSYEEGIDATSVLEYLILYLSVQNIKTNHRSIAGQEDCGRCIVGCWYAGYLCCQGSHKGRCGNTDPGDACVKPKA